MQKPRMSLFQIANMAVGFFGIQIAFGLQNGNASRVFETLGAEPDKLALFWMAGPVTGLLVQPIIGHFSDNTWTRFGRRRPFFLAGAIWAAIALFFLPNVPALWMAVMSLWILDAAINISMEPFRAFVGDLLPARQRTAGYAMQTIFIGLGGMLGSFLPLMMDYVLTKMGVVGSGGVPLNVKLSFAIGAVLLVASICWTVFTTKEYSPEETAKFSDETAAAAAAETAVSERNVNPAIYFATGAGFLVVGLAGLFAVTSMGLEKELLILGGGLGILGGLYILAGALKTGGADKNFFSEIIDDLSFMPRVMKQLAVVQFFSWVGFFVLWIYSSNAIANYHFGASDPNSEAFQDASNFVTGVLFTWYNLIATIFAFLLPVIAKRLGLRLTHAINLFAGAAGLASYLVFTNPWMLLVSMTLIGMAWASVLTMPYAMLSNGIPQKKMGIYMGIFNFFIVLPQLIVATVMGSILNNLMGGQTIYIFLVGGATFLIAGLSLAFVDKSVGDVESPNF